jgi:hypothetical protein
VGYMPELNVLCGIGDFSSQSDQPMTKHLVVEITRSEGAGAHIGSEGTGASQPT